MAAGNFWNEARIRSFGLAPAPRPLIENPHGPRDVASVLDRALEHAPDSPALVGRFGRMSYAELDGAVNATAAAFAALGVGEGDRIAASSANHNELVIAFLASQRIGAVWVGVNHALALPEKRFLIEDCGASLFLCDCKTAETARTWIGEYLRHVMTLDQGAQDSDLARALVEHRGAPRPDTIIDPWAPAAVAYTSGTTGFPKGAVHMG